MHRALQRFVATLVVASLLLASASVGVLGAAGEGGTGPTTASDPEPADTVYVTDDGDLVLAYRTAIPDTTTTARTGLEVGEAAMRTLLVDEDGVEDQLAGGVNATLTPAQLVGAASVSGEDAGDLRRLRFRSAATQSASRSRANLSLSATVDGDDPPAGELSTSGSVAVGPDEYAYAGEVVAEGGTAVAAAADGNASVTLAETDDGYRLSVERVRTVPADRRDDWATREAAAATLSDRFDAIAADLDGESDLTLDGYGTTATDDGGLRVDVAYTVTYTGVERALSERLARSLAADRDLTLSPATTDDVADRIAAVGFDRIHAGVETDGDAAVVRWDVRLDEYAALPEAVLSIARSQDDLSDTARSELATYGERLDAREASGLVRTVAWDGTLSADGDGTAVSLTVDSGTEGWADYAARLTEAGIGPVTFGYDVSARTVDGRIAAEASLTVEDEALVDRVTTVGLDGFRRAGRLSSLVGAFRSAGFDRADLDVSVSGNRLTAAGSARFSNGSAFSPLVDAAVGSQVDGVAARALGDQRTRYVRVQNVVGPDPTRADVRALPVADADTTVRLPGEWNRSFPDAEIRSAESMGLQRVTTDPTATATPEPTGGGGLPGFGPLLGLAAVVGALAGWRRRARGDD